MQGYVSSGIVQQFFIMVSLSGYSQLIPLKTHVEIILSYARRIH